MKALKLFVTPVILFISALFVRFGIPYIENISERLTYFLDKASTILIAVSITWAIIAAIRFIKTRYLSKYDLADTNNIRASKLYTQFNILERIIVFLIILIATAITLMTFEGVREIGVSIFASAGIAGIIVGFAAQKALGTILAGLQIAISQPIRVNESVIVEGEMGTVEEITLTYVVVKIWDERRLILPTTYFIEQPFQNWTRNSPSMLGTVYLYVDYNVDFEDLRHELSRLLEGNKLWDKRVNNIQVTEAKENYVELRALVSARNSSQAWDLRVYVRENLIKFIRKNYPDSFVKNRVFVSVPEKKDKEILTNT